MENNASRSQWMIVGLLTILLLIIWTFVIVQLLQKEEQQQSSHVTDAEVDFQVEFDQKDHDSLPIETEKEIQLSDYNFSDISTPEGVPIDGVLDKLDLR